MAAGTTPPIQFGLTRAALELQTDDTIKIAPSSVVLSPAKLEGRKHRSLIKNIINFIEQRTANLPPSPPAGVSWVTRPGAPVIVGDEVTETASTIRVDGTNKAVASATINVPFANPDGKRTDAIAINYGITPAVYTRVAGEEGHVLDPSAGPVMPADHFFVRFITVTDGLQQTANNPVQYIYDSEGKTTLPDVDGGLFLDLGPLEENVLDLFAALATQIVRINDVTGTADASRELLGGEEMGDDPLATAAQTVVGAINELLAAIAGLGGSGGIVYKTGTTIDFVAEETHFESEATPANGNIVLDMTGAVVDHMAFITMNMPTYPLINGLPIGDVSGIARKSSNSGNFILGVNNYIIFDVRSTTLVKYTISQ